jgi:hypothetical protein
MRRDNIKSIRQERLQLAIAISIIKSSWPAADVGAPLSLSRSGSPPARAPAAALREPEFQGMQ